MIILSPLSWLYRSVIKARNALYDRGVLASNSLGARTISVGNMTTGGTGKTPLVACIAVELHASGEKVCILTRGYGRANESSRVLVSDGESVLVDAILGGDEPVELARKLLGKAIVIADADRVSAARWALDKFEITAFILDDAFQHRRVKRDLDILCIDATDPFGNRRLLPAGPLREPLANLGRADAVVLTRTNLVADIKDLVSEINSVAGHVPVFTSANRIKTIAALGDVLAGHSETNGSFESRKSGAFVFCGIGNPSNFFGQLTSEGFEIAGKRSFPDHHYYDQADIDKLEDLARLSGANTLLTTAKDAAKLSGFEFKIPCYVVETELVMADPAGFRSLITAS